MKNRLAIAVFSALISTAAFAQKDEMKTLKKMYDKETMSAKDLTEYNSALTKLEAMMGSAAEGDKVYYTYYKAVKPMMELKLPENQKNIATAMQKITPESLISMASASSEVIDYEKKSGKKVLTDDIREDVATLKPMLMTMAIELGKAKQNKQAADLFYAIYLMDKNDKDTLFYAASYAVTAQDYPTALKYYQELKQHNYTGEGTVYYAKNSVSGQEESFNTKADRDNFVRLGSHNTPREEKIPSRRGEIYRNIALILTNQGKAEEARAAIAEARLANPDDESLILEEANLALQQKDYTNYKRLVSEALAKNPNNADLVYNLGVLAGSTDPAEAEKHYKRAIELNPKYTNAYLNLAILKLEPEKRIIDEMNKLGTSEKDNKRYEVLKKQREEIFRSTLPYLEKASELAPQNEDVYTTLYNVYGALEMMDKRKALKARAGK